MKTLLVAASAIGLLASAPAMAATGEIGLTATVTPQCGTGNHLSGAAADSAWNQDDIVVALADGNGQFKTAATYTNRSFGNVWCNGPANVTMEVKALTTSVAVADEDSFANRFDIEVNTDAGVYLGHTAGYTLTTVGESDAIESETFHVPAAFETGLRQYGGANSIKVLPSARGTDTRRPVAGAYSGYVRFTATVG